MLFAVDCCAIRPLIISVLCLPLEQVVTTAILFENAPRAFGFAPNFESNANRELLQLISDWHPLGPFVFQL